MPTSDTTLEASSSLVSDESLEERGSSRRLDDIGVEAVLGAMIEQKRRSSRPSFAAVTPDQVPSRQRDEAERFVKAR